MVSVWSLMSGINVVVNQRQAFVVCTSAFDCMGQSRLDLALALVLCGNDALQGG